MSNSKPLKIPYRLILLDLVGAVLAAMGILQLIDGGGVAAWIMTVVGFLLMMPLVLAIFRLLASPGSKQNHHQGDR
ncbi:hypothetical protein [uncultured Porticoccus sp.]|uniref:hypothetical protein n=1 Tax=uncultured Porticoccus sp. TaxID=1256050 RepID=UPI0030D9B017